ncbi:MAG: M20/M25/M40 family metallo-hydrolase [Solirubrobacterales bacterium]
MASETPPLLAELLQAPGPAGFEERATDVWRGAASFAALGGDRVGSTFARVGEGAPVLGAFGHIDEIGLIVSHIDEKGLLWFSPLGYWDAQILVGQRVEVQGREGAVPGVIGRKPIHVMFESEELKKAVELRDLHVDVGATSYEEATALVSHGDPIVVAGPPLAMAGDRLVSKSMDNRLGAYIVLEALRRYHEEPGGGEGSFVAVASVREELGLHGAKTASYALDPDVAITVDVSHESAAPGMEERFEGKHEFGSGAVIGRAPILSDRLTAALIETAEVEGIPYTVRGTGLIGALGLSTGTDADATNVSRGGVPSGVISIPLRYMHSPVEMVDLRDVEACVELLAAFARRLTPALAAELDPSEGLS